MFTDRSLISNHHKRRSKSSLEKSEVESMDTHKSLESLQQSISKVTSTTSKPSGLMYVIKEKNFHIRKFYRFL
jgi:hypothetical protein